MLKKCSLLAMLSCLSVTTYANIPLPPQACPGSQALYDVGFDLVRPSPVPGGYTYDFIQRKNHYDTADEWTFILSMASLAPDEETAKQQARSTIQYLDFNGPDWAAEYQAWQCWAYRMTPMGDMVAAIAFTPPRKL